VLINLLVEGTDHFLLILDDYQLISKQEVHTTLTYLIEHLPAQLRLIVATRADPPLPLSQLRACECWKEKSQREEGSQKSGAVRGRRRGWYDPKTAQKKARDIEGSSP
jgi:hypothetical protein